MNLDTYLKSTTAAGYDHFGLRRFAANLIGARRDARRLIELLEEIQRADEKHKVPRRLASAIALAGKVVEFFPSEYHVGGKARSLTDDLRHAGVRLAAYPESWSLETTTPEAVIRARFIERFLLEHGAPEIALAFGRSRTLHDNSPFIVIFAGMTSGVASFAAFTVLLKAWALLASTVGAYAPWLTVVLAVICGLFVATEVGVTINEVLKGEHVVPSWPLVALALRWIPRSARLRYEEEFRAEIYQLGLFQQLRYSVNLALRAFELRRSLASTKSTEDADYGADGTT